MKKDMKGTIELLDKFIAENHSKLSDKEREKKIVMSHTQKQLTSLTEHLFINFKEWH